MTNNTQWVTEVRFTNNPYGLTRKCYTQAKASRNQYRVLNGSVQTNWFAQ